MINAQAQSSIGTLVLGVLLGDPLHTGKAKVFINIHVDCHFDFTKMFLHRMERWFYTFCRRTMVEIRID